MLIHRAAALNDLPGIAHGFFGRDGGVSAGLYESLNCGPGSKDDPAQVAENRARAIKALAPGARLATLAQIHSAKIHTIAEAWDFTGNSASRPEGDGLVTKEPGVMLGILTADCGPVLFADAGARVIGAAHAGWKGAMGGVLEATLTAMEKLGARASNVTAVIGPAISRANYEVGEDLRARFGPGDARFFTQGKRGHYHFDLSAYIADRLGRAGVGVVADLELCTYPPQNGFFSYRRATHRGEGDYGRELSAIALL